MGNERRECSNENRGSLLQHVGHIHRMAEAVAEVLGLDVKEVERLAAMSQEERAKATAQ